MIRWLSAIVMIGLAAGVATAQQDPIAARKSLMKDNGDQAKIGAAMAKGEAPFDLAKARKIFATFENTAVKAPALFPENSIDEATADDPYIHRRAPGLQCSADQDDGIEPPHA